MHDAIVVGARCAGAPTAMLLARKGYCPPVALRMIFDVGPFALKGAVTDTNRGRGGFCPRRTVLDKMLVDAAVEAGAELREGFICEDLVWDSGRLRARRRRAADNTDATVPRITRITRSPPVRNTWKDLSCATNCNA